MSHLIIIFKHACHYRGLWVHWILARALGKQANQTVKPRAGKVKATKMIIRCNKNLLNSKESVKELWRIKSNVSFPKRLSQKCCANKVFYAVISCALHWKKYQYVFCEDQKVTYDHGNHVEHIVIHVPKTMNKSSFSYHTLLVLITTSDSATNTNH